MNIRLAFLNCTKTRRLRAASIAACLLASLWATPVLAQSAIEINPLAPPDRSSPRATLESFLNYATESWRRALAGLPEPEVPMNLAIRCIDLDEVPLALRDDVGMETTLKLFDVLNRVSLPPLESVPDIEQITETDQAYWRIPETGIFLVRETEGPRSGEWLFSGDLVELIDEYYLVTHSLPLTQGAVIDDGYKLYTSVGGSMLPNSWLLALPDWALAVYLEQAVWQWLAGIVLIGLTGGLLVRTLKRAPRGEDLDETSLTDMLLAPLAIMAIAAISEFLFDGLLNFTGDVLIALRVLLLAVFYLAFAWVLMRAGSLVAARLSSTRAALDGVVDLHLIRIVTFLISLTLVVFVVALGAQSMGVPVLGVLTGLGVGGIAVALAAQTTLENFIGALALFSDKPLRVGETCRFGDKVGTIEHIGLRSTRIRTVERTVLSIPNGQLSKVEIENLALRDKLLLKTVLAFSLDTSEAQLQRLLERLRKALDDHPMVDTKASRVRLDALGPMSTDVGIFAYVKTQDWGEFLKIREALFLRFLREIDTIGLRLMPPAQVQYNIEMDAAAERDGMAS